MRGTVRGTVRGTDQLSLFQHSSEDEAEGLKEQVRLSHRYTKNKRNWENDFQRWCNAKFQDDTTSYGSCGWGAMCDYCEDNSYGRPCVRALNEWCREKGKTINYDERDYEKIWRGDV